MMKKRVFACVRRTLCLTAMLAVLMLATLLPASAGTTLTAEYTADIAYSGDIWWECGVGYPRVIVLQHSQLGQNNVLLATSEEGTAGLEMFPPGYPIYRSTDQGKTWVELCYVQDSLAQIQSEWQPTLFELPAPLGEYPAGTIFLAACSIDADHVKQSAIRLYASTDGGETFGKAVTIAVGGGLDTGVWEPYLVQLDDGTLVCYYSDSTEVEDHSQKIVYKTSKDGITWSDPVDVIATDRQPDRPGMPVVTRLGDGTYFMIYEWVNHVEKGGAPVMYRTSTDGLDWGDPLWEGVEVVSVDGKTMSSAPYCAWTPVGGENGTIIVSGTFMRDGSSSTGTDYFLSTDNGKTWTTTPHVIPFVTGNHRGYSNAMVFTADGKVMYAINNPSDPKVEGKSKLVCAMVEWVEGAAALLENIPTFVQEIPDTDQTGGTDATPTTTAPDAGSADHPDDQTALYILLIAAILAVLGCVVAAILVKRHKYINK